MLKKIDKEMDEFASGIKTLEGHDKLLDYMNSSIYSTIKLLIFASNTFSIYGRVLFFFIISLAGLGVVSGIGLAVLNTTYLLVVTVVLVILILLYIMHFKKSLILYIEKSKNNMENSK
ncbi:MAG: hypothetical protein C0626_07035 [Arcobacter sp.]|uniref:hypothetical protein n=1 Tax=uncultured Arcobacter sp. TaxID=165434 RepID=UPI000CB3926F|nr:hypothetical protein [uncultured Arcobacter sp.]PLY10026.1 MAG: hypothetical protein C0626_07035 [Arcobacter sp.]